MPAFLDAPYITFVVSARNDEYGGRFLSRMEIFLDVLTSLWSRHRLRAEVLIVEWNPPADRPRLRQAVAWPRRAWPGTVRIISVPNTLHRRWPHADQIPLFEYLAKNVGIRRARGEYVVATNPDIIFSEPLIRYLARGMLKPDRFYRADRYTVTGAAPGRDWRSQLAACRQSASTADLWGEDVALAGSLDGLGEMRLRGHLVRAWWRRMRDRHRPVEKRLHTNAAGDFFLMRRSHWHALRGYPEQPTVSLIDGSVCVMAASAGLRQMVLPSHLRIYHQEHTRPAERPRTEYSQWAASALAMLESRQPVITNGEEWGLGADVLEEHTVETASDVD